MSRLFYSILYESPEDRPVQVNPSPEMQDSMEDLQINRIINTILSEKEEYDLKPFFWHLLYTKEAVNYRQQIMVDLENPRLFNAVLAFSHSIRHMNAKLNDRGKSNYKYEKERFFLDAVDTYCNGLVAFSDELKSIALQSKGLLYFRDYLSTLIYSKRFITLSREANARKVALASVKYSVLTREMEVQVRPYIQERDYSITVEETFSKFRTEAGKDYRVKFPEFAQINHIEAAILEGVSQLFPEIFKSLSDFCARHINYEEEQITIFNREINFYLSILEYISILRQTGLKFCYPEITNAHNNIYSEGGFDLALAYQLVKENKNVVTNNFFLSGDERIIIVTGPNQGGKTTFARTFGQLHYLAALGCPVPGTHSRLFLFDHLFTHFEREESLQNLRSKLEDDLFRIHNILKRSTPSSIVIMNEILSSTTLHDAILLSKKIMEKIDQLDMLSVWVTFVDELVNFSKKTVSMVSMVEPNNPALRTHKIERRPANGLAYALSLAEKYHVTYEYLIKRISE